MRNSDIKSDDCDIKLDRVLAESLTVAKPIEDA